MVLGPGDSGDSWDSHFPSERDGEKGGLLRDIRSRIPNNQSKAKQPIQTTNLPLVFFDFFNAKIIINDSSNNNTNQTKIHAT